MLEFLPLIMFALVCLMLMLGYPVALTLMGTALLFGGLGYSLGVFDASFLQALPNRLYGLMTNQLLVAVPLFIFMGVMLEKSKLAEQLLTEMARAFVRVPGGLAISVALVGLLLAASTGIVGATVVTMGLITLPSMLKQRYSPALASGTLCAVGTLGQIIPPSTALILLGDVLSSAYQQAQLNMGIFAPETVSVGDLFMGALLPGLLLVMLYLLYIVLLSRLRPDLAPAHQPSTQDQTSEDPKTWQWASLLKGMLPPLLLIIAVLGSILSGLATPSEGAGVGALGASLIALARGRLSKRVIIQVAEDTTKMVSMIFSIFIGAAVFSLVFKGFGGDELIHNLFAQLPGGTFAALWLVMLCLFLLGFILDFIEITFIVVPLVAPVLLQMGIDPVWLGIMIAINLQTSFLTPPFGFSLFYLRGVAPKSVQTSAIYRGVVPFIGIQLVMLMLLSIWPTLATWLPNYVYG